MSGKHPGNDVSVQKVPVARDIPFGQELKTFSISVAKPPKTEFTFRK